MNINELKKELKHWEDMVPVNNMGKLARQTKIDNLKKQIEDYEKFLKDKMDSLFETINKPEIMAVFKRLNDK